MCCSCAGYSLFRGRPPFAPFAPALPLDTSNFNNPSARMARPLTKAEQAFAVLVAGGESAASAYRKVHPKASAATAKTCGPECARKPHISLTISELRAKVKDKAEEKFAMTKLDMLNWLKGIITTPIGEVHEMHHMAQEFTVTETAMGGSKKVKMPGKVEAAEKIIKMMGWNEPEQLVVDHNLSPEAQAKLDAIFGPKKK